MYYISLLIFFPDIIVKTLHLDKGFDDDNISIRQLNWQKLIGVAVFLLGGYLFFKSIAPLLVELSYTILISVNRDAWLHLSSVSDGYYIFYDIIDMIIGLLLMYNFRRISIFIVKQNKMK